MSPISNKNFLTPIAWLVITTAFLVMPGNDIPKISWSDEIYLDKIIHIFLFSVLAYSFYLPLKAKRTSWIIVVTILCFGYGVIMEFVQKYWIPDRSFDIGDIVADGIGCFISFLFIFIKRRKRKRKNTSRKGV